MHFKAFDSGTSSLTADQLKNLDKPSADSAAMMPYWTKVRDIVAGEDAIINASEEYLPKFPLEHQDDYAFRLKTAVFTNVYRDVLENLASKPFESEVSLSETADSQIEEFAENVDGAGNNLTVFAAQTFFNAINSALDWIFVDYSNVQSDPNGRTVADEKRLGIRPFWTHVQAMNVLEVQSGIVNGVEKLTFMRILEPENGKCNVRVLYADEAGARWELYEKVTDAVGAGSTFVLKDGGAITIGVIPMVPVVTGRRIGRTWNFYPMMKDAANLQITLFQKESGLSNVRNLAGFPMLAGQGVKPATSSDGKTALPVRAGPSAVLYAPPMQDGRSHGSWEWITPSADVLNFLSADIDKTKQDLRELGRQPLTAQSGNLTVITTAVAAGKARSAVKMWALALQDALNNALVLTAKWYGITEDDDTNTVKVFDDWDEVGDNAQDLTALQSMRAGGDLSQETYWFELRRRNVLSAEFDPEEERERLLNETPNAVGPDSIVEDTGAGAAGNSNSGDPNNPEVDAGPNAVPLPNRLGKLNNSTAKPPAYL